MHLQFRCPETHNSCTPVPSSLFTCLVGQTKLLITPKKIYPSASHFPINNNSIFSVAYIKSFFIFPHTKVHAHQILSALCSRRIRPHLITSTSVTLCKHPSRLLQWSPIPFQIYSQYNRQRAASKAYNIH